MYDRGQKGKRRTKSTLSIEKDTVMRKGRHARYDCTPGCAVEATLCLIDGKWKGVVLFHLLPGTMRFSQIRRLIPNVTQRTLTNQLRELEEDGLIVRTVFAQVPPRVDYSLTARGRSLAPVLQALKAWGDEHMALFNDSAAQSCTA